MTWSCRFWEAMIRFRISRALSGILILSASSTQRMLAMEWTVVHTPQKRWVK